MTPRSPKPHPKTSTISRRLRNRADQNLSHQPPELPHFRGLRSRRAVTLPSTRRISGNYPPEEEQPPVWNPSDILDPFPRSNTSHPAGLEEEPPADLLLSQSLQLSPYNSPHPLSAQNETERYQAKSSSRPDLASSPLPSLSDSPASTTYQLHLSAETEQLHPASVQELQDMR